MTRRQPDSVPSEDHSLTVAAPIRATTVREWFPARAKYYVAIILVAASCKPWTVRPIGESVQSQPRGLDASAYVTSIWTTRVLPYVRRNKVSVEVLDLTQLVRKALLTR